MRRDIGGPPNNRFVGQGPCALRGGRGTGVTDCHTSDIGHWLAMTWFFARGAVGSLRMK